MDMNHLIGQRFNLISKSDIRYVGTLHEINPEASTIALENVVSFGTEGRRGNPAEEIAPSTSVYEYIVFRGSDVKDISVAEEKESTQSEQPQVPDDPAILGVSETIDCCILWSPIARESADRPTSMSRPGPGPQGPPPPQSQPPPQQSQAPHPAPPSYPQPPQFQGFYPPYGQRFGGPGFPPGGPGFPNMPYGAPPGWFPPPGQGFPPGPGQFPPQVPIGPPGHHQTPPQQRPGPAPTGTENGPKTTSELPVGDKPASRDATPAPAQVGPIPPVESKPSVAEAIQPSTGSVQGAPPGLSKVPPTGPRGRVQPAIPIAAPTKPPVPSAPGASGSNVPPGSAQAAITEASRAATAAVAAAMAKLPQPTPQKKQPGDGPVEHLTKQIAEMKPYEGSRPLRGGHQHARGGRGNHRSQHQGQSKKVEVPDTDYDFQTANARFNKQDLLKEAITSGAPVQETEPHPDGDVSESADPGADSTSTVTAYNKASSFFDNISSEARDREEGAGGRGGRGGREWRGEEEKRNIETFGQGSVDGYRGGYRGRGRNRGRGYGRGGYGRGYGSRGRGGIRGGRNVSQSTGVPTQT
ncbi:hypothetical protein EYZ11_004196 [Aspergillus tanneri]|uniref:FFD box profile domain-containing protein n=1 Tax=Aspergillus tanneri TaxID=1220188 RepID=A0A4S3JNK2_9EURO|nr:uncharacterized protein ATNIH1004_000764 [Aspergillus tanneri]KAA8651866.1 hypothetical protein ATNIH1004_000764 [Aspergillus tanneri]THC96337.1 hypothetical protein EYZ11_004196 [Aspergillus tanneri]